MVTVLLVAAPALITSGTTLPGVTLCGTTAVVRGICVNNLKERQDWIESRLLEEFQKTVLKPEVIDYTLTQFEKQLSKQFESMSDKLEGVRRRRTELESELRRLATAVATTGHSMFLLEAIADREREIRGLTDQLVSGEQGSIQAGLSDLRRFVHSQLDDVKALSMQMWNALVSNS